MTEAEFRNTVMPHHRAMTGVAMAILGNVDDVRDCLQDSLTALWTRRKELRDVVSVEAYCIRTVRNNALSMLRQQRRLDSAMPEIVERLNPETMLENRDRLAKVLAGIESLPDVQRNVVKLSTMTGLPPDDVAKMSGLSPGNVRTILSRARKQLRNLFKDI